MSAAPNGFVAMEILYANVKTAVTLYISAAPKKPDQL